MRKEPLDQQLAEILEQLVQIECMDIPRFTAQIYDLRAGCQKMYALLSKFQKNVLQSVKE